MPKKVRKVAKEKKEGKRKQANKTEDKNVCEFC